MQRIALAVVLAGIAGTLANTLAAMAVFGADRWTLATVPARYGVAILVALALPGLDRLLPSKWSALAGFAALTILPSLNAKLVLGVGAPWGLVLALNAVYALAALVVYRLIRRWDREV